MATRYVQTGTTASPEPGGATELATSTDPVTVGTAVAPTVGQVLTATSPTTATWQDSGGGVVLASTAPADVDTSAAAVGVGTTAARADHKHDILIASPAALVVGGSAVTGTSTSVAAADHVHALAAFGTTAGTFLQGNDPSTTNARTPTGSAGGDLGGTYPNPTVSTTAALKSASTNVNTSSATAPTTGQVLTATDSTHATWQAPSGSPTGSAGGDLGGTYPNPTVSTTAALKSASTNVNTSSATAPSSGQVLTATSNTAATWQTPASSLPPNGSAGGDLSGTYPNPTVATSSSIKSATTNVNTSSATAPSAGQSLIATSSTAATWQSPSTDLGGTWAAPTVTQARGLKSASTTVSVSAATAPTTGQVLTAIDSTTASWQSPGGASPLFAIPSTPHADDVEFDSITAPAGWELYNDTDSTVVVPSGAIDPYATLTAGTARLVFDTDWRKSYLALQVSTAAAKEYSFSKGGLTLGTDRFIWMRLGSVLNSTWSAPTQTIGLGFFSSSAGHVSSANSVIIYVEPNTSSNVYELRSAKLTASSYLQIAAVNLGATNGSTKLATGQAYEYVGIHKKGTTYHFYAFNDSGAYVYLQNTTHASTFDRIGFFVNSGTVAIPGSPVFRCDFIRNIASGTTLPF